MNDGTITTYHKKGVTTDSCPDVIDWDLVTKAKQYIKDALNHIVLVVENGRYTYYFNGEKVE